MASAQDLLGKINPPRVRITYNVEVGNAIEDVELPFVLGILADLAGTPAQPLPPLKDRKFVEVNRDNINDVMASLNAQLPLQVPNVLGGKNSFLEVLLSFKSLDDLDPVNIVQQVPEMNALYTKRQLLRNLLTKLDGNEALDTELGNIVNNSDVLNTLKKALATK